MFMFKSETVKQQSHFDLAGYQYDTNLILNPPVHTREEIGAIVKHIKIKKLEKVADFGAGTGRLTIPLAQHGFRVVAVDVSTKSLERLRKVSKKLNRKIKT